MRYYGEPMCDPEALNDWRANDEAPPAYDFQGLYKYTGEINYETRKHTLSKEQKEHRELLLRRIEEALELETRRCRALREEGET